MSTGRECACGCGQRTSAKTAEFVRGHRHPFTLPRRFWSRVDRRGEDDCWPWIGPTHRNGYATISVTRTQRRMAHRVSYELATGTEIPDGMTVDHLCGQRACMNPGHMEIVTRGENSIRGGGLDSAAAKRHERAAIQCHNGHDRDTYGRVESFSGSWRCRACINEQRRSYRRSAT